MRGLPLAVNQNGRWAPHMARMRAAVRGDLNGEVVGLHCGLHWSRLRVNRWVNRWVKRTPVEAVSDLVLHDFGVRWVDFETSITGSRANSVFARAKTIPSAGVAPPMGAFAMMDFEDARASLDFDAATRFGARDRTHFAGSRGSLPSYGPDLGSRVEERHTEGAFARPTLTGQWFNDGFAGTMGALLVAFETGGVPGNAARGNLDSLANCFAALASARLADPVSPLQVVRREA
ncbi:Gfo/Idh/MocA family protein [Roseisalinus antarcticus]|uniref:GFO/IDH/MocA-like oxidoreductase domain-containing protein n=1 Tax=Roseisalinus antarcticus TaxID=254357 RepID=A0A1Y5TDB8_9RHOB|nr:hypothetical protein [Roseisalinus antarcticus]SLN61434.1 hypothetical protein ROA7023_02863 [Roseisalinus antarcticus]